MQRKQRMISKYEKKNMYRTCPCYNTDSSSQPKIGNTTTVITYLAFTTGALLYTYLFGAVCTKWHRFCNPALS